MAIRLHSIAISVAQTFQHIVLGFTGEQIVEVECQRVDAGHVRLAGQRAALRERGDA